MIPNRISIRYNRFHVRDEVVLAFEKRIRDVFRAVALCQMGDHFVVHGKDGPFIVAVIVIDVLKNKAEPHWHRIDYDVVGRDDGAATADLLTRALRKVRWSNTNANAANALKYRLNKIMNDFLEKVRVDDMAAKEQTEQSKDDGEPVEKSMEGEQEDGEPKEKSQVGEHEMKCKDGESEEKSKVGEHEEKNQDGEQEELSKLTKKMGAAFKLT